MDGHYKYYNAHNEELNERIDSIDVVGQKGNYCGFASIINCFLETCKKTKVFAEEDHLKVVTELRNFINDLKSVKGNKCKAREFLKSCMDEAV